MYFYKILVVSFFFVMLLGCKKYTPPALESLPILSERIIAGDTFIYKKINPFAFKNFNQKTISLDSLKGKIHIAEFFFPKCQSVCPLVMKQLKRVEMEYANADDLAILSFSLTRLDADTDLLEYRIQHNIVAKNWYMLYGDKDKIYDLANVSYRTVAYDNGGKELDIMHNGALVLVDKDLLIRGMYDGKDSESVSRLLRDIKTLWYEKKS